MVLERKEVGGCSSLPGETGKWERELQLSAGCSLHTGKGLHQYKIIVKGASHLKEDRDILQQVVFTHIGFPPYIWCSLVWLYVFQCSCSLLYGTDIQVNYQYWNNNLKYKYGWYIEKNLIILIHPPSILFPTIGIRAGPSEKLDRLKVDRAFKTITQYFRS